MIQPTSLAFHSTLKNTRSQILCSTVFLVTSVNVNVNVNRECLACLKQPKLFQSPRERSLEKFKLKCHEMTGETRMSLAVAFMNFGLRLDLRGNCLRLF